MDDRECEVCGGTHFYQDDGHYFCSECQTQSQAIVEHQFEREVAETSANGINRRKNKTKKLDDNITSWECYNVIMHALTEQLIKLGAKTSLKPIVKCLWMKYLHKLEVFHLKEDARPRLQLVNSRKDVEILYDVKKKKRKRKRSSDESSVTTNTTKSSKRVSLRKVRVMAKAKYAEFSFKSSHEAASLQNATLSSLKSSNDNSDQKEELIYFNRYANKELKKKFSVKHCVKHRKDMERDLKCHKITYGTISKNYKTSVHFLSPVKIYAVLYLGLLINRDEIQLGDLLRFIREGHVCFNNYLELFPEEFKEKNLNIQNHTKNRIFSNKHFRTTTAKLATFLDVTTYVKPVDITSLCKRYCKELNLPDELCEAAVNLISKSGPKLTFKPKSATVPNYEGRAMSVILFTVKLLFGLDGKTEWKLSEYARLLNQSNGDFNSFDVVKWLEYIGYRKLTMNELHFPTAYSSESDEVDSDLFLRFVKSRSAITSENVKIPREMNVYHDILTRIRDIQGNVHDDPVEFPNTLTPFRDYAHTLNLPRNNLLYRDFQNDTLNFLLNPFGYLRLLTDDLRLQHGGANDNWVLEEVKTYRNAKLLNDFNTKVIPIEISDIGEEKYVDEALKLPKKNLDASYFRQSFENCQKHVFRENEVYLKRLSKSLQLDNVSVNKLSSFTYCMPYERYWLYIQMNANLIAKSDFERHFDKFPNTFKLVFRECARIIEQTTQELFTEFQASELYLVYCASYSGTQKRQVKRELLDGNLKYYVNQAESYW